MKNHLTPAEVNAIYAELAASNGNAMPLRDPVLLEMACARPQLAGYGDAVADAAVLVETLVATRPFGNANEATAFAALQATLDLNDLELACSPTEALRAWDEWLGKPPEWKSLERWLRLVVDQKKAA